MVMPANQLTNYQLWLNTGRLRQVAGKSDSEKERKKQADLNKYPSSTVGTQSHDFTTAPAQP
jgi:hypothetical protein